MNFVLDVLFPKRCVGCSKFGTFLCASCKGNIMQAELVCPKCERASVGGQTHPICRRRYGLDGLWSLGVYQGSLKSAIGQLKYKQVTELAGLLCDILVQYWARYQPFLLDEIKKTRGKDWAVVGVPLHWYRNNWRGFNQSSLIGQSLSNALGLDYLEALKKVRYTRSQVRLKGRQRQQNIRNAFVTADHYIKDPIPYILLVDDVWTTGSTLRECCYVLKRNGAKRVWALTLAR